MAFESTFKTPTAGRLGWPVLALTLALAAGAGAAQATTCMVMGERSAVVRTPEGDKSPVFLSQACESLRLVSGKALVSWVGRDGKPQMVPVGVNGVERLPAPGAEERPASSVWAELTSKRDAQRSAYMRALGDDKATRLYLPEAGLSLRARAGSTVKLARLQEGSEPVWQERPVPDSGTVLLERAWFQPGAVYQLDWEAPADSAATPDAGAERWRVRPVSEPEQRALDERFQQVAQAMPEASQQLLLQAMVYEQLKLPLNLRLTLAAPAAREAVHPAGPVRP
ncbi:hypothetical protein PSQ40_20005 [Curvibacter sp. HBC61]|uniref:DUF4412 domain-containing protein n=1 Tax=Curvibacter cyanobacteriorum TaxID=3026422 RepID=A0ABT5N3H9_9BURK|nr:hypothetical protein [Curvibacter sp. HBC61]MDD0840870.1 hypothetical protein [Curvibacter sp. HBC61]